MATKDKNKTLPTAIETASPLGWSQERVFTFLVYTTLFLYLLYPYKDFDWGWHYRYGEYFLTHWSVLRRDPFSWIMEGYNWVNHSWLYDPLLYLIYENFSFTGLSIAGAIVSVLTFYIGISPFGLAYWQKGILAVFFYFLMIRGAGAGLRAQLVGFLLLSLLLYLLFAAHRGNKRVWILLPLLFCAWANLHGSFVLGLVIFAAFLLSEFALLFRQRTVQIPETLAYLSLSFAVSLGTALINPFTYDVYLEAFRHFRSPLLVYVVEWTPSYFIPSALTVPLIAYTTLLVVGFAMRRRLADLPWILVFLLVLYLAIRARRFIAVYAVVTLPIAALMLKELRLRAAWSRMAAGVVLAAIAFALGFAALQRIPKFHLHDYSMREYCDFGPRCSEGLTEYLLKNPPSGRGFNFYNWGGYLIGRGLSSKLFVDGRMHLWKRNDFYPYLAYWQIYNLPDMRQFSSYEFDWVIAETRSTLAQALNRAGSDSGIGPWRKVYSDARATYFIRKE